MAEKIYRMIEVTKGSAPFTLTVTWEDGVKALVDIRDYVDRYQTYEILRGNGWETQQPQIGEYGWMVDWIPDEVTIPSDTLRMLWMFQTDQAMHPADFSSWMERHNLSLTTAAAALGISRRMVAYYKNGERVIPRYILLACKGYEVETAA